LKGGWWSIKKREITVAKIQCLMSNENQMANDNGEMYYIVKKINE
jgi:hypothetical protein